MKKIPPKRTKSGGRYVGFTHPPRKVVPLPPDRRNPPERPPRAPDAIGPRQTKDTVSESLKAPLGKQPVDLVRICPVSSGCLPRTALVPTRFTPYRSRPPAGNKSPFSNDPINCSVGPPFDRDGIQSASGSAATSFANLKNPSGERGVVLMPGSTSVGSPARQAE